MIIIKDIMGKNIEEILRNICIHMGYPKGTRLQVDLSRIRFTAYLAGRMYKEDYQFKLSHDLTQMGEDFRNSVELRPGFITKVNMGVALHDLNGMIDDEYATFSQTDLDRYFEKNSGHSIDEYDSGEYDEEYTGDMYHLYNIPVMMDHTTHKPSDLKEVEI